MKYTEILEELKKRGAGKIQPFVPFDGEQATEYSREYLLWVDVKEYELKLKKDKVYRDLAKKFNSGHGDIEQQELYKTLTLEDLREIERIIENRQQEK